MATEQRPNTHYQLPDWFTNNYSISTNSERQQDASVECRQEGRYLCNETYAQTKWDQYSNNIRLADRVDQIRKWKEILEKTLEGYDKEIEDLSDAKNTLEQQMEDMNLSTDVNVENLTTRDGRQATDIVDDEPDQELKKEAQVIDGIKAILQQRISEGFEQLVRLQEARQQIQTDLQDKNIAMGIDIDQYNLSETSPNISYKPDPLRVPKGSTTLQQWEDCSRYIVDRAQAEMKGSRTLRETIHHTQNQAKNDLEAQRDATEYAFRKRMHDFERAIDELDWQKKNTEEEIAEMENDLRAFNDAIVQKRNHLKKVQTRLENRTTRPNVELCSDAAHMGLTDEAKQLESTVMALKEKFRQAQHALDGLQKNLHRINDELDRKTHSLMLDRRCMDVRERLKSRPQTAVERNLTMTGIERLPTNVLAG